LHQAFAEGARAAGKDAATMPILVEQWVVVGDKQEAEKWAPLWQYHPKSWESFVNDPDPRDIQRRAQQEVPIEQVVSKWTVGTDPQVHIDALQKLIDGGVTYIVVHSAQEDQQHVIDFYSREVLPRVRR
jgi:F420-dependent hydroxymycolic acid dehydrogenase